MLFAWEPDNTCMLPLLRLVLGCWETQSFVHHDLSIIAEAITQCKSSLQNPHNRSQKQNPCYNRSMSNNYADVNIGVTEMVTGHQIKLNVDDMLSSVAVPKGAPIVINGERKNAQNSGTMVRLKDRSKVYVDADVEWVRGVVRTIKALAQEEQDARN